VRNCDEKKQVAVLSLQNVTKTNWYCTKNFNLYPSFFYDDRARARAHTHQPEISKNNGLKEIKSDPK